MITMGKYEIDSMVGDRRMPEWVRSERYEFCEDFYESYTTEIAAGPFFILSC